MVSLGEDLSYSVIVGLNKVSTGQIIRHTCLRFVTCLSLQNNDLEIRLLSANCNELFRAVVKFALQVSVFNHLSFIL